VYTETGLLVWIGFFFRVLVTAADINERGGTVLGGRKRRAKHGNFDSLTTPDYGFIYAVVPKGKRAAREGGGRVEKCFAITNHSSADIILGGGRGEKGERTKQQTITKSKILQPSKTYDLNTGNLEGWCCCLSK